jgi:putative hydrolase of the HAD superfamily
LAVTTIISDFGGVLTTPLVRSFMAVQDRTGIPMEALGRAMQAAFEAEGVHPLFELECGRVAEADFLTKLGRYLEPELGHRPELHDFREMYFEALDPNDAMFEALRARHSEGYKMALLTNNVREWEPLWRSMLPIDEIFEVVVDSAFVGHRKPDPEIYAITLERLGDVTAAECVFIDDIEANCVAARDLGFNAIQFRETEQVLAELDRQLAQ